MNLNASMNNTMTERFNVSGALLVKLFGRHHREAVDFGDRAGRVRDIGVKSAMYSRVFIAALTLVGAIGTALVYWWGGHQVIDGGITPGTLVALGLYTVRIYIPLTSLSNARADIMTAFVSFERVFEVLDTPTPLRTPTMLLSCRQAFGAIRSRMSCSGIPIRRPELQRRLVGARRPHQPTTCSGSMSTSHPVRWWRSSGHPVPARPP